MYFNSRLTETVQKTGNIENALARRQLSEFGEWMESTVELKRYKAPFRCHQ
jgi:hypothetical protein